MILLVSGVCVVRPAGESSGTGARASGSARVRDRRRGSVARRFVRNVVTGRDVR
ncbi:hypothetical protein SAMN05216207_100630 [Pseudonocardia ammonioxydans]|uniref:Uncharacterized protein n=1 Tax=Pseudonocardia ammonioxydans TaxID=260086 RepID=A0A1I4VFF7_PSUAM|nr:hypothetical protein SAMN05216207_100630 [Pseudonocardia ammonioxydans]